MSPLVRWARRRRPLLTAAVVLGALFTSIAMRAEPADLLDPAGSWRFWVAWSLMVFGVAVRLWGAGNLHKNREITRWGVYTLVRHPLYFGSLALFLAYFLTVGNPVVGVLFFLALVGLVYFPTMITEEHHLRQRFPEEFAAYRPPPRFLPDLGRLPEAFETDQFSVRRAYRNLGFRTMWFIVALPLLLWMLGRLR